MGDEVAGGSEPKAVGRRPRQRERARLAPLPPEAEARFLRRAAILVGLIPLPQMTQDEADWLFRQRVRLAE